MLFLSIFWEVSNPNFLFTLPDLQSHHIWIKTQRYFEIEAWNVIFQQHLFSPCIVSTKTSLKCQKFHFFYPVFTFPACSQIFLRFYNHNFSLYDHTFCLSWNFLEVSKISFYSRVSSHFLWDCIMPVLHMKLIWQLFFPQKMQNSWNVSSIVHVFILWIFFLVEI